MTKEPPRSLPNINWKCLRQIFNQEKCPGRPPDPSDSVFLTENPKIAVHCMGKAGKAGEGVSKSKRNHPGTKQTSKQWQQSVFQPKKSILDPPGGVSVDFWKSGISAILECGNRTFKFFQTFFKKAGRGKLFCAILAHIKTAFKQKRTKSEFSRNKSYPLNAAHFWPKCFRPQKPKISYIYIANKSCQSKKVLNDQRTTQESAKHQLEVFQTDFQSREMVREASGGLWPSVFGQKSQNCHTYAWKIKVLKKKCLHIRKKQLWTLPNIKGKLFRHICNWQMLSGIIPEVFQWISGNLRFWPF